MHFKIDENLSEDVAERFCLSGFEASTVIEQGLKGYSDESIAEMCRSAKHVIVSLDLDFGDVRDYPPSEFSGIIVLRLSRQGHDAVLRVINRVISNLKRETVTGRLWIVDEHRLRIRE